MSAPKVPVVVTVAASVGTHVVNANVEEILLRARSSNVQAIAANVKQQNTPTDDPTGTGDKPFVLFPGESVTLPVKRTVSFVNWDAKYIIFNDDTDLDDPVLEIIEIAPA